MRFELYSLICQKCGARNHPMKPSCVKCGGPVRQVRRCPGCQKENPPNAYVCIFCYRKFQSKPPTGFINFHVPWPVSILVLFCSFGWFSFNMFRGWVEYIDTQTELRTQEENSHFIQQKALRMRQYVADKGSAENEKEELIEEL